MGKITIVVSFSGGRTSAYMAHWMINNKKTIAKKLGAEECQIEIKFAFANTGLEHPKTLEFINRCDKEWGLDIVWLEAVTHKELKKGQTYKIVSYESAARNGEPYKLLASIEGLPNPARKICSDRLKGNILRKYRNTFGKNSYSAIGIRVDEFDRMNPKAKQERIIYPLISMRPTRKPEIINWFKDNHFDLEIPEHLGNCVTCWKKSDRKLFTIAKNNPEYFTPFKEMEASYSDILSKEAGHVEGVNKKIFRKERATSDIIEQSKKDFIEWTEIKYEEQLDLLGIDQGDGCEESCEPF